GGLLLRGLGLLVRGGGFVGVAQGGDDGVGLVVGGELVGRRRLAPSDHHHVVDRDPARADHRQQQRGRAEQGQLVQRYRVERRRHPAPRDRLRAGDQPPPRPPPPPHDRR